MQRGVHLNQTTDQGTDAGDHQLKFLAFEPDSPTSFAHHLVSGKLHDEKTDAELVEEEEWC